MNENFRKQISQTENLKEIAEIISQSTELHESISKYSKEPYDEIFGKGIHKLTMKFGKKGDTIYLLGDYKGKEEDNSSTIEVVLDAIEQGLLTSAHTLDRVGLFAGLIESCALKKLGFDMTSDSDMPEKDFLFNDNNQSILVSVSADKEGKFVDYIYNNGLEITLLGHVTKGELRMDDISFGYITDYLD
ncbi:MAG: hypothetical protein CVU12_07155 [Bacteroidetes bacterium HGW-Bacteroidetes-7]|jgi:hypothetical protein|nr:MAG: hypothetical protein CVU12_07155 [Bacteroidetes bacterium HGW-Bacteroidetes-7]